MITCFRYSFCADSPEPHIFTKFPMPNQLMSLMLPIFDTIFLFTTLIQGLFSILEPLEPSLPTQKPTALPKVSDGLEKFALPQFSKVGLSTVMLPLPNYHAPPSPSLFLNSCQGFCSLTLFFRLWSARVIIFCPFLTHGKIDWRFGIRI